LIWRYIFSKFILDRFIPDVIEIVNTFLPNHSQYGQYDELGCIKTAENEGFSVSPGGVTPQTARGAQSGSQVNFASLANLSRIGIGNI
jgi:hypothetical protein